MIYNITSGYQITQVSEWPTGITSSHDINSTLKIISIIIKECSTQLFVAPNFIRNNRIQVHMINV